MLFDLYGRRRTVIKATYLSLAILLGGGLVLFGIGSGSIQGGFADFLIGQGGNNFKEDVEKQQKRVNAKPKDPAARAALIRARFNYAGEEFILEQQDFTDKGKAILKELGKDWQAYLKLVKKPDIGVANFAVQAYIASDDLKKAVEAQRIVAAARPEPANYLALVQYAVAAGDQVTASAAAVKAVELAPHTKRKEVQDQIDEFHERQQKATQEAIQRALSQQAGQSIGAGGAPLGLPTPPQQGGGAPGAAK